MFTIDGIGDQLDLNKFAKEFFKKDSPMADVSVDSNANVVSKSVIEFNFEFPKPLQRYNSYFLLWKEMKALYGLRIANEYIELQINGSIYINDFVDVGRPYCFNFSTYDIALSGLEMSSRMVIKRPKGLESFLRQVEQFTVYAANSTLGATGLADFLIVAAWFYDRMKEIGFDHKIAVVNPKCYLKEKLSSFIYTLNWEFRGNQSPFTNVSVYDDYFLKELAPDYVIDETAPTVESIKEVQRTFLMCMNEELHRSPLTFPVTTACMSVDKDGKIRDTAFKKMVALENLEHGFINFYYGDTATLSSCCRLRSEKNNEYFNSFGAGSTKIGSLGVVTLNLPRLAHASGGVLEVFIEKLKEYIKVASDINAAKRNIIQDRIKLGAMPLYSLGHMDLSKQYATVGVNGVNECLEILGLDVLKKSGQSFLSLMLDVINDENDAHQKRTHTPHNCEQVPAESSAVKLASKDKLLGYDFGYSIYSNQFIPLTTTTNIMTRLRIQGMFDKKFSGGAVCHVNLGSQIKEVDFLLDLMDYAAECGVVYWAVNYALKRCSLNHVFVDGDHCPECGGSVAEVFTRVVGFFTNVRHWNPTRRRDDWPLREFY